MWITAHLSRFSGRNGVLGGDEDLTILCVALHSHLIVLRPIPALVAKNDRRDERPVSVTPPLQADSSAKRRKNSSSPEASRSRSPPPAKRPNRADERDGKAAAGPAVREKEVSKKEDDLSNIHPSRRGMMGGGRGGRAKASDFM